MKEYIDIVNSLYEFESKTLAESLQDASEFEIDLILESMDSTELVQLKDSLMEFTKPSDSDVSLLTKIGGKIFGGQWAEDRIGNMRAMNDAAQFNSDWNLYSKRFKKPLTVDNLKKFLEIEYKMSGKTADEAFKEAPPEVDRRTQEISNMDEVIPALAHAYFYAVGDAIEQRAEEKHIDIDDLGYDDIPNNNTDFTPSPAAAKAVAGGQGAQSGQPNQDGQPGQPTNNTPADAGDLSGAAISKKMGNVLGSLHVSTDARQQAMNDAKKGFQQSFSKNSRTLAAIGYAYLKAIGAS